MDIYKYATFVKNVGITEEELLTIMPTVLEDIAISTKFFKRMYGFSTEKDLRLCNFFDIALLNQRLEMDVADVSTVYPTQDTIRDFLSTSDFIEVNGVVSTLEKKMLEPMIDVHNIYDENGANAEHLFVEGERFLYEYIGDNDHHEFAFVASVVPSIDSITIHEERYLKKALIEGLKYFTLDNVSSANDGQMANIYYQRYDYEKKKVLDLFPVSGYRTVPRPEMIYESRSRK